MEETLSDIRRAYGDSLRQLEDLRKIGGASMAPLANQIQYHLTSMLDSAQSNEPLPVQHKNLAKVFKNQIRDILFRTFPAGEGVKKIVSYFDSTAGFALWENALKHLDRMCEISKSFDPSYVEFSLENDSLVLKLVPTSMDKVKEARVESYRFTQELFKQNSIFTYSLNDKMSQSVELRIRYSVLDDKDLNFCVGNLSFNPIFSNYVSSKEVLNKIGEHHIVMIDQNANVKLVHSIPDQETLNMTMIHLPFLFRPLSLIIFGEGRLQATHAKNSRVELFKLFR